MNSIIAELRNILDDITPEEAMEFFVSEVRAFKEREQEDEDKPWAK